MAGLILWAAAASLAAIFLAWRLKKQHQDVYDFSRQLEKWLDELVSGREIKTEADMEDTLTSKINEKISRVSHIWTSKTAETQREKEAIKELISDLSHQTKTPIANMKIYLELLEGEKLPIQAGDFLRNIGRQTDKLDFLLRSMVKMSRMETGIIRIQKQRTPLIHTVGRAVEAIVPKAEAKQLRLSVDCGEEITVNCDSKWTEEAIFNILDNAVKYTDRGGKIRITVTVQEIFTKISVQDSGKGIALERQAEIFARFYREPEVHNQEGIGIGLYLARKIIEMQNGYMEVHSRAGEGSDFQIYLPND
ncbi:MAG: HAMP domain-containing histidine kinase [Firmicutes bacterium]|nr:HAMP domain-containing histidine kinase [Bacillota bacterium]NBI62190.1 sensor histidine kinase [Clostridiales bacterium]